MYVIASLVFDSTLETIDPGQVWVARYLFKPLYDATSGGVWAHWIENASEARAGKPILYEELVRTSIEFLPSVRVDD